MAQRRREEIGLLTVACKGEEAKVIHAWRVSLSRDHTFAAPELFGQMVAIGK